MVDQGKEDQEMTQQNPKAQSAAPGVVAKADAQERVHIHNLTVTYPDGPSTLTVLDDVSMSIAAKELTMLSGESGSGKSTLLAVVAGLTTPDSGQVIIDGTDLNELSEKERSAYRCAHIGIVFQQPNLLGSLNAREQLVIVEHMRGLRGKELQAAGRRADELLERVGLGGLGDRRIAELSGGQRQRVGIARAIMNEPAVLLADEPTSALDSALSAEIVELLAQITHDIGCATLMITHDRQQLPKADRQLTLEDGVLHVPDV